MPPAFLFLKITVAIWGLPWFHTKHQGCFFQFCEVKNATGMLIRTAKNLQTALCRGTKYVNLRHIEPQVLSKLRRYFNTYLNNRVIWVEEHICKDIRNLKYLRNAKTTIRNTERQKTETEWYQTGWLDPDSGMPQ